MFLLRSVVSGNRLVGTIDDPQLSCTYMGSNLKRKVRFNCSVATTSADQTVGTSEGIALKGIANLHVIRLTEIDPGSAIIDTSLGLKNLPD